MEFAVQRWMSVDEEDGDVVREVAAHQLPATDTTPGIKLCLLIQILSVSFFIYMLVDWEGGHTFSSIVIVSVFSVIFMFWSSAVDQYKLACSRAVFDGEGGQGGLTPRKR